MKLYTQIQKTVQDHCATVASYSKKRYVKESMVVGAIILLMVGGYFAFGWYQKRQNVQAFAALVEISKSYEQAVTKAREQQALPADMHKENPWEDTQILLEALTSANSGSSLAPFFVMYQAQLALEAEGDFEKACKLMKQGLARLSKNSIYYDMFNLKRIKMLLDSPEHDVQVAAVNALEKVANNKENYYAQEALYTLGAYQAFHGNMEQAIQAWTTLAQEQQSHKALINSSWVTQAQEKLKALQIELPAQS